MQYQANYYTDIGNVKQINQDSLCIKKGEVEGGELLLAVLCDGMGGLSSGEIASASVIMDFSDWFSNIMLTKAKGLTVDAVKNTWQQIIEDVNRRIYSYGRNNGVQLGTTLTAMLFFPDGQYIIAHVGDTRAYQFADKKLFQLTDDQTFVAREIKMGRMTPEEAKVDKRKNVLLQCVGGEKMVTPSFYTGMARGGYLMCSDGFRHAVEEPEIADNIAVAPENGIQDKAMLKLLVDLNKSRGERDNITALFIRCSE